MFELNWSEPSHCLPAGRSVITGLKPVTVKATPSVVNNKMSHFLFTTFRCDIWSSYSLFTLCRSHSRCHIFQESQLRDRVAMLEKNNIYLQNQINELEKSVVKKKTTSPAPVKNRKNTVSLPVFFHLYFHYNYVPLFDCLFSSYPVDNDSQ